MASNSVCAAIPVYKTLLSQSEIAAFQANVIRLHSHGIPVYLVTPESLNLNKLPHNVLDTVSLTKTIRFSDSFFASTRSYDFLMMSELFYSEFLEFRYLLVCQLDALVLSVPGIYSWLRKSYSYVGAPWFYGCDNPRSDTLAAVGNGGFSLRNITDHLFAIRRMQYVSPGLWKDLTDPQPARLLKTLSFLRNSLFCRTDKKGLHIRCHEDYFFGVLASNSLAIQFTTPSPSESVSFSYEVNPRMLHRYNDGLLPAGCHAWEKYDREFWIKIFYDFDLPILKYL